MKKEGFWYSITEPHLPKPLGFHKGWKGQQVFISRLRKIEAVAQEAAFKGSSICRLCGCRNGSSTFTHNGWSWPSGFSHYVKVHNVEPTKEFQVFINSLFI